MLVTCIQPNTWCSEESSISDIIWAIHYLLYITCNACCIFLLPSCIFKSIIWVSMGMYVVENELQVRFLIYVTQTTVFYLHVKDFFIHLYFQTLLHVSLGNSSHFHSTPHPIPCCLLLDSLIFPSGKTVYFRRIGFISHRLKCFIKNSVDESVHWNWMNWFIENQWIYWYLRKEILYDYILIQHLSEIHQLNQHFHQYLFLHLLEFLF